MLFRRRMPAKWPSPHHHKCDNPECNYPNQPQAAPGKYRCLGQIGDVGCQGRYKVSEQAAQGVDAYWRRKFVEERKIHEQENKKKRVEEAERWRVRKMKEEEERKEKAKIDEMFLMEERRRREAKWKLKEDQQRLRRIDERLKEIEEKLGRGGVCRPKYDKIEEGWITGLRQEQTFLREEYDGLLHSIEERRRW